MAEPRRLTELADAVEATADLPPGNLAVALSGGADSAALLWLCSRLGREIRAIHVHHGLPASDMLAAAAAGIADALGVALTTEKVTVPPGPSPEDQARRVRYDALTAAAAAEEWVLTAHTSDDQAETVLDHLLRGSGLDGLSGIPARRFPFARPLLRVSRSTTREVATLAGLPWEDDPLNLSPDPLRNRIRSHMLPELELFNRRIRESLATTARLVARDAAFLEEAASPPVQIFEGGAALAASFLTTADPSPAARMVRRFLSVAGLERASPEAVEGVLAVARGEIERHQPGGNLAVRRRGAMVVAERGGAPAPGPADLVVPGQTRFRNWVFDAYLSDSPPTALPLSAGWMVADAQAVGSLRVESAARHPDALRLLADGGVRAPDRDDHPVVVASQEIVWIPGVRRVGIGWVEPATARYLVVRSRTERIWQR